MHFCRQSNSKSGISAFTLTELIIVIVMVFIIAATLMPMLLKFREASILASCSNNLRRIGVGCNIYASCNNDYWPAIDLPGSTASAYLTSVTCRTVAIPSTQIAVGPFSFAQLYFYAGVNDPKVFYCPAVDTGINSYPWYTAPGYAWPAMTPLAASEGDASPFVRCGYNFYPQPRTTQAVSTSSGTLNLPAATFVTLSFTPPNPPGGTSPNSTPAPALIKTTQLNLSKVVAVDSLNTWTLIQHQYRGQPYAINALFPDSHVRLQTVAGNNQKRSNEPFDPFLWDPSVSGGPGQTAYSSSPPAFRIIMNGFQP